MQQVKKVRQKRVRERDDPVELARPDVEQDSKVGCRTRTQPWVTPATVVLLAECTWHPAPRPRRTRAHMPCCVAYVAG